MGAYSDSPASGTGGMQPDVQEVRVIARGGAKLKGQVVVLDEAASDADVSTVNRNENSVHRNVINAATANHRQYGKPLVCLEAIEDNREGRAAFGGQVQALVKRSGGAAGIVIGTPLVLATDGSLNATLVAGEKVVGKLMQALAATTTPQMATVLLSGDDGGFGTVPA